MKAASVSPERATVVSQAASVVGVGSALNDTIQQAGTALGIAILGSLLWSGFARRMPAGTPDQAKHSIAGALAAAQGDTGLGHAAREAFTASMSTTFTVSAIGILAAALLATLVMRDAKAEPAAGAAGGPARTGRLTKPRRPVPPSGAPTFFRCPCRSTSRRARTRPSRPAGRG
ncbi:hypothetical protein ACFXJ5_08125 [Streptomyces sp. NPDC059373]